MLDLALTLTVMPLVLCTMTSLTARFVGPKAVWITFAIGTIYLLSQVYQALFLHTYTFAEIELEMSALILAIIAIWGWWCAKSTASHRRKSAK